MQVTRYPLTAAAPADLRRFEGAAALIPKSKRAAAHHFVVRRRTRPSDPQRSA